MKNRFSAQTILAIAAVAWSPFVSAVWGQQLPGDLPTSLDTPTMAGSQPGTGMSSYTTRPAGIDPKSQAQRFLQLGREALQTGNLQQAAHWGNQASALAVQYGIGEDTPEKLFQDIRLAEQRVGGTATANTATVPNPMMANTAPAIGATAVTTATVSPRLIGKRNHLIIDARVALASGDVPRATRLAQEAGAMNVPYNAKDDTHQNVLKHIDDFNRILEMRKREGETENVRRLMAKSLLDQSQVLLGWGKLEEASQLALAASRLGIQFNQFEVQPKDLLARIENARKVQEARRAGKKAPVEAVAQTQADPTVEGNTVSVPMTTPVPTATPPVGMPVASHDPAVMPVAAQNPVPGANPAVYNTGLDNTQNIQVNSTQPVAGGSVGYSLLQQAQVALQQGNREQARQIVAQAMQYRGELDAASAKRLNDLQMMLSTPDPNAISATAPAVSIPPGQPATMTTESSALLGQLATELSNLEQKVSVVREEDPQAALQLLKDFQTKVEGAGLAEGQRDLLLKRTRAKIVEMEGYIADNQSEIDLKNRNRANADNRKLDKENLTGKHQRLQEMTEEFNRLVDEMRFAEAEALGKRAKELFPEESAAVQLYTMGKMLNRMAINTRIRDAKEEGVVDALLKVDESSIPFTKDIEYAKNWDEITKKREKYSRPETRYSEKELDILKKMSTPIQASFENQPLQSVMETLGKMTGISIHLAPDGLSEQGVAPSQPVTLVTQDEISLKSALNLILGPMNLDYVIRNEVLMITSKGMKDTDIYQVTYPVADLVIPIPNFQPSANMGLEGALRNAMSLNQNNGSNWANPMMAPSVAMASRPGSDPRMDPAALGQSVPIGTANGGVGTGAFGGVGQSGFGIPGAGGSGGAASADFDSLIELITKTIKSDSWEENGGSGSIAPFPVNLSLVISQTQENHEQIADLLKQLRRLQDLQVTIEVRFITLSDSFYERIGVDFQMNIRTDENALIGTSTGGYTSNNSATIGHNAIGTNNAQPGNINLINGSAALATPSFGGYDPLSQAGAQLGFAILSDVEAYLFMEAAQSTKRSNILQAPKVTLFNGQQAFVADTSQTPFVISVTPVVGDFAAALQPVIVVLSEGTFMTVQAVVSADRRYVRLTVVPYFSQIGNVEEFTFTGTNTTSSDTTSSGNQDDPNDSSSNSSSESSERSGTSVQLPTFSFVTVTTTVSVPDGGTILLGGIKRLSEGRDEMGVPILNKIPFINRLFKNTGIGRDTSSLMMMVTPRIIIQEEEDPYQPENP
ncbi:MAG: general secretion pathway protein GspD [Planctomycetia bacterium]|nr:general secretion pathway protein GspD [Planctomycetia bacterium]